MGSNVYVADLRTMQDEYNLELINEIQNQKRKLEHILSSINEVVWSCTAYSLETIYINDACYEIYGYTPHEIMGDSDLLFGSVHPDDKKQLKAAWRQLLRNDNSIMEYRIIHKDGSLRYIKNEAVLRRDKNDIPEFINGFARDVTIQKKQMLEIKKQNEKLQEIAWIQSHKLRGPLASILGLTNLFDSNTACANNIEIIDHIRTAARQLDAVVHDIVAKSKLGEVKVSS
jgi:PAS domain S-box-containing protein